MKTDERTFYSPVVTGDFSNHRKAARFDITGGYVGIQSYDENNAVSDRVLLTPDQWEILVEFVKDHS